VKQILFLVMSASFCSAATGEIRFRAESLRGTAAELARQAVGVKEFGLVNRLRYRIAKGSPAAVEREPVVTPDPQKGTQARPAAVAEAPWIREIVTSAPAGAQIIGWGDFDNDGSDELLIGWPAIICKRTGDGNWVRVGAAPSLKRSADIRIVDSNRDGLADIIAPEASGVTVFWNQTALPWVRHVIAQGFRNQSAAAGNFAGAGRMDVISGDIENDRKIQLFRAPDWSPTLLRSGIRVIQSAALDIDGDGLLDYIGVQYRPGLIFWLEHPRNPASDPWPFHLIDDFTNGLNQSTSYGWDVNVQYRITLMRQGSLYTCTVFGPNGTGDTKSLSGNSQVVPRNTDNSIDIWAFGTSATASSASSP